MSKKYKYIITSIAVAVISYITYLVIWNDQNKSSENQNQSSVIYQANKDIQYKILKIYERKPNFFTQGYLMINSTTLLESTGGYNTSFIHYVDLKTQQIFQQTKISPSIFGEGSDIIFNKQIGEYEIYMLTWLDRIVYVFDLNLKQKKQLSLPQPIKEGWGLTHFKSNIDQNEYFIVSDGSNNIYHLDIEFNLVKTVKIQSKMNLTKFNELEMVDGKLFANIFMTHNVAVINPETGQLYQLFNFNSLNTLIDKKTGIKNYYQYGMGNCLNGIAYYEKQHILLLTGKNWPLIFQIEFLQAF